MPAVWGGRMIPRRDVGVRLAAYQPMDTAGVRHGDPR